MKSSKTSIKKRKSPFAGRAKHPYGAALLRLWLHHGVRSHRDGPGASADLRSNEDVKEFYLGMGGGERKSFRDVKSYKRRKRWLALRVYAPPPPLAWLYSLSTGGLAPLLWEGQGEGDTL